MSANIPAQDERSVEIDLQYSIPLVAGELVWSMTALYASAVDEDVNPVLVCKDGGNDAFDG